MRIVDTFEEAVEEARRGVSVMAKCPAHDDGTASLSVSPGTEQPVIFKCHAMCDPRDVVAAAGMEWEDVCRPLDPSAVDGEEWTPRGPASHVYSYYDEQGTELYQALRIPLVGGGKTFSQRHKGPDGKWVWNLQGIRRVLYRLPELLHAVDDGRDIWLLEGEKDVDRAWADGKAATCNPMGAGKWSDEFTQCLAGARVTIVADNDGPGREHARHIATILDEQGECDVRIVETPLAGCKDYSDHRNAGGTDDMLLTTWTNVVISAPTFGLGIQTFITTEFDGGREIIPNMLAEANVAILVGAEGHGKSLMLRQMAIQCAAGLTPFSLQPMQPLRSMFIDAENPEFQQMTDWKRLAGLAARHTGEPIPDENLMILSEWRNEPDLLTLEGQSWLIERITAYRPQIVFMGPVQNLVGRDVKDDEVVRKFKRAVNHARAICGTAFVIEHHAPHRAPGDKERQMRPYGSSLFMKWPDYGYGLKETEEEGIYDLYPFRKPRVRARAWVDRVRWGKPGTMEFPWEMAEPESVSGSVPRIA